MVKASKKKAKTRSKAKLKASSRKKAVKKKPGKKKTSTKKAIKKKAGKKKTAAGSALKKKKSTARKPAKKPIQKASPSLAGKKHAAEAAAKAPVIEPGPPLGSVPPVEEPTPQETAVGIVTHYYSHLSVAVVQVNTGSLRTGDTVRFKGHTTDFIQPLASMEYEHRHVDQAEAGQNVGIKVIDHAREHDIVYVVK